MNPYEHLTSPVYVLKKLRDAYMKYQDPRIRRKIIFHMEEMLDVIEDQEKERKRRKEKPLKCQTKTS